MGTLERAINKLQASARAAAPAVAVPVAAPAVETGARPVPVVASRSLKADREALLAGGLLPPVEHLRVMHEQFRGIKRPLLANAFDKSAAAVEYGNLLMVTSALAGEGKSFVSFNLALSMAQERERPVLLIDADVAKPHITGALGAAAEPGLLDLLDDNHLTFGDVLMATDLNGLFFVPSGRPRSSTSELLASRRMQALRNHLATAFDGGIVLFDSPPLLLTNESRVLGGLVGQIALVVAANMTPQASVHEAIGLIDESKSLNLILNRAAEASDGHAYGVAYGRNE